MVEAAGVGQASAPHSKQLIDSAKLKSVMIRIIFRSWHNPVTKWPRARNLPASRSIPTPRKPESPSEYAEVHLNLYT